MVFQMVRRDVQEGGDRRMEAFDVFQLIAGGFHDHRGIFLYFEYDIG